MLMIGLAAAVLSVLTPQEKPGPEALLAPAMTPNEVAAFCFAPANRQPGERDRECQYRVLQEDARRVEHADFLRRRCERQANSPGGSVEECALRLIIAEQAAAEAARAERAAAAERARTRDDPFGDLSFDEALALEGPPPPPPPSRPYTPPRPNCRSETVVRPDGSGSSVSWVCGNDDALNEQVRERLLPRP